MAVRAWRLWGTSIVLAGGVVALAEPPRSEVNGRATPAITQEHFQPESAPAPRVLPQQVLDSKPSQTAAPGSISVLGLQIPAAAVLDLDIPVRVGFAYPLRHRSNTLPTTPEGKARLAFEVAESHFFACEITEARNWYREVIHLAPDSEYARTAGERLKDTDVRPVGGQSEEPPLADAQELQVRLRIP